MSKPKVVPIQPPVVSIQHDPFGRPEPTIVSRDETKLGDLRQRVIIQIGNQRVAWDFTSRATQSKRGDDRLPPDQPNAKATALRRRSGPELGK